MQTFERQGEPWIFGADIGGTRTKYGVTDAGGEAIYNPQGTEWIHSRVNDGPDKTLRRIADVFRVKVDEVGHLPVAAGIACAGQIGLDGVVNKSANFGDAWNQFPLAERARQYLGIVTVVENDANAHTLAEYMQLVSRDSRYRGSSGFLITLGTGLGSGRVNRGGILERGEHGWGEELGHQAMRLGAESSVDLLKEGIVCGCKRIGCAEQYTSLKFLQRELEYRRHENPNHELYQDSDLAIAATKILGFTENGDLFARSLLNSQARNVGLYLAELIETRDPAWTLIGGGITDASPRLRGEYLEVVLRKTGYIIGPERMKRVLVDYASLGSDAGWVGGAISAAQILERSWSSKKTP
jgi:predicted NBD/HSP70 family sugar kinase